MKKTLIIIQARMGSKRLPGKMMLKLDNYSILEWVIKRIKSQKQDRYINCNYKRKKG